MDKFIIFYNSNKGGINGAVIGILLAVFILIIGFFNTIFIASFALIGYYIGKKISNDKDYLKKLLDRILPPGTYR